MFLGIVKNFCSAVPVLSGSIIFLCSATVGIVSRKPNSYGVSFVSQDKINGPIRLRIVIKQLA